MTNGRGAGMAFMIKKKKYKFQVEFCLEELLEVPFVSAVLFAKLRLLDGGFQDHSTRIEVAEHAVKWGSRFSFSCKMLANASTGILEPCILRISVRKECKGGRSFTKLGFVDLNLAEFAGAGETSRKALLEGYDNRRRQDNSMLRFSIKMNMLSGDILFKVPSPSLKHKPVATEDSSTDSRPLDDYSSGSLAGSIASASSGFGSLPKKRPALLTSELIVGQTQNDHIPVVIALDNNEGSLNPPEIEDPICEQGHSRNSSNTSQMSKASGYSSIHSHSRQSSSGDSGHIRNPHKTRWFFNPSSKPFTQATRKYSTNRSNDIFSTPKGTNVPPTLNAQANHSTPYFTPKGFKTQSSNVSSSSAEEYKTPEVTVTDDTFPLHFNENKPKSCTCNLNGCDKNTITLDTTDQIEHLKQLYSSRYSLYESELDILPSAGVLRSKSDFEILHNKSPPSSSKGLFQGFDKSNVLFSFLTPSPIRKKIQYQKVGATSSSPSKYSTTTSNQSKLPSPRHNYYQRSLPGTRNGSPTLGKSRLGVPEEQHSNVVRLNRNPSSSSLVLSETGSLDRAKAALERRKKAQAQETDLNTVSGRVEVTRVNPDHLIAELLKSTNLEQPDDSAETSGLQLFIAKDGTAALGNHEVKSQMSTGVQTFKQVVMEDKR
ncbi:uncharacterized protein LOC116177716 isoform X1 [Photinus pyralis]|nr:uncharacterized protein LOC116177716 isoform X1 [Photinus pyralis]XP_031352638.1 uncharacterized protein LOC116177716 isoform X1 [Photinus pyralis]XP_031352639.1 uncharacterized protein LOC116177716 isoform X1 [Photinus pyralis]